MTISIRSDAGGTSGAIQVNGTDKLIINSDSTVSAATPAAGDNTTKLATTAFVKATGLGSSGQAWQDLRPLNTRSLGVTYTNSTGRPILVAVTAGLEGTSASGSTPYIEGRVSGVVVGFVPLGDRNGSNFAWGYATVYLLVPDGATYVVSAVLGSPAILSWAELR